MLPLKLLRSLVLGEAINNPPSLTLNHHHTHTDDDGTTRTRTRTRRRRKSASNSESKTPALLFLPSKEIVLDTYRLASIARQLGMDLHPSPTLSHIVFSSAAASPASSPPSTPSTFSFSSSSASWSPLNDAVPIPFPSLSTASLTHLRFFVTLSKGLFKLVFFKSHRRDATEPSASGNNWDCCSVSLCSSLTGDRIDTMEAFCAALAGKGWTFFRTKRNPSSAVDPGGGGGGGIAVYLFRKVDVNRVRVGNPNGDGACRMRELRLPHLDFGNAPLRILQYILLMTDDIFCLA
ncbi:uncharacterized protein G2W53_008975 [Senna tora]|uniref:Uncharacterized protein n=1 Tax=Senna tora TaxID=362788 RepID=A0A835C751_9FABA|nr:uncharacterized protein G2W53_008975 [Senna tora]